MSSEPITRTHLQHLPPEKINTLREQGHLDHLLRGDPDPDPDPQPAARTIPPLTHDDLT